MASVEGQQPQADHNVELEDALRTFFLCLDGYRQNNALKITTLEKTRFLELLHLQLTNDRDLQDQQLELLTYINYSALNELQDEHDYIRVLDLWTKLADLQKHAPPGRIESVLGTFRSTLSQELDKVLGCIAVDEKPLVNLAELAANVPDHDASLHRYQPFLGAAEDCSCNIEKSTTIPQFWMDVWRQVDKLLEGVYALSPELGNLLFIIGAQPISCHNLQSIVGFNDFVEQALAKSVLKAAFESIHAAGKEDVLDLWRQLHAAGKGAKAPSMNQMELVILAMEPGLARLCKEKPTNVLMVYFHAESASVLRKFPAQIYQMQGFTSSNIDFAVQRHREQRAFNFLRWLKEHFKSGIVKKELLSRELNELQAVGKLGNPNISVDELAREILDNARFWPSGKFCDGSLWTAHRKLLPDGALERLGHRGLDKIQHAAPEELMRKVQMHRRHEGSVGLAELEDCSDNEDDQERLIAGDVVPDTGAGGRAQRRNAMALRAAEKERMEAEQWRMEQELLERSRAARVKGAATMKHNWELEIEARAQAIAQTRFQALEQQAIDAMVQKANIQARRQNLFVSSSVVTTAALVKVRAVEAQLEAIKKPAGSLTVVHAALKPLCVVRSTETCSLVDVDGVEVTLRGVKGEPYAVVIEGPFPKDTIFARIGRHGPSWFWKREKAARVPLGIPLSTRRDNFQSASAAYLNYVEYGGMEHLSVVESNGELPIAIGAGAGMPSTAPVAVQMPALAAAPSAAQMPSGSNASHPGQQQTAAVDMEMFRKLADLINAGKKAQHQSGGGTSQGVAQSAAPGAAGLPPPSQVPASNAAAPAQQTNPPRSDALVPPVAAAGNAAPRVGSKRQAGDEENEEPMEVEGTVENAESPPPPPPPSARQKTGTPGRSVHARNPPTGLKKNYK